MAWRDFYQPAQQENAPLPQLTESQVKESVATVVPVIVPPVEELLTPQVETPATELQTESGVACRIEGNSMPLPRRSDGSRLCANVHRFLG